jgi:hypothetical protein
VRHNFASSTDDLASGSAMRVSWINPNPWPSIVGTTGLTGLLHGQCSVRVSVSAQFRWERALYLHDSYQFPFVLSKIQSETWTKNAYLTCLGFNIKKAKKKRAEWSKDWYLQRQSLSHLNLLKRTAF